MQQTSCEKNMSADRPSLARFFIFVCVIVATLVIGFTDAEAATKKKKKAAKPSQNQLYSAIIVDAQNGEILLARAADSNRHPASLTKIMTLYMTFDAIKEGSLSLNDRISISKHAASMSPSKLGLRPGQTIRVEDAIKAIVTKSANDIAAALGERLGGTERAFASRMTRRAHAIGMSRTTFRNASGLPDPQQVTTARDMAKLAMALLRDFPDQYHYFGIRNFEYKGAVMRNHNRLLGEYPGLDGIKTGYINASGFNLVASAKQNGHRLIGVVFGGATWKSRNDHMVKLLDEGFADLKQRKPNQIQEASISNRKDVTPAPPPMYEDAAGVGDAGETPADNTAATMASTDDDAEDAAYAPQNSRQISSMIDAAQAETQTHGTSFAGANLPPIASQRPAQVATAAITQKHVPSPSITKVKSNKPSAPASAPAKTTRTATTHSRADDDADGAYKAPTMPAGAARTVMQLRIPRAQVPVGAASTQIASASLANGWSVQVGAFQSRAMTDQALRTAQSRLPSELQFGQPVIIPQSTGQGLIFRARLQGFSEIQANAACAKLGSCVVVSPGS